MKWYSVKKYIPQTSIELLIRAVSIEEYERYFIASTELIDDLGLLANWYMANGAHHDIELHKYRVTHFAIIDPVEIEQ